MSLAALRNEITAGLAAELTGLPAGVGTIKVSAHEGAFTAKTLELCAKGAPHVVVAFVRTQTEIEGGTVVGVVHVLITVITKHRSTMRRDVAALHIVQEILRVLNRKCWDVEGAQRGFDFEARNMYTEDTLLDGCCLWGISYKQRLDLLPASEAFDDLLGVDTTWDLYPRNDGDDLGDEPEANDAIELDGPP